MRTTAVRCARRRELRNCHVSGNFVPATALALGAVKTLLADVIVNERILFPKFGAYIVYHAFFKKSKKIIG